MNHLLDTYEYQRGTNLEHSFEVINIIRHMLEQVGNGRGDTKTKQDIGQMILRGNDSEMKETWRFCDRAGDDLHQTKERLIHTYTTNQLQSRDAGMRGGRESKRATEYGIREKGSGKIGQAFLPLM